MSVCIQNADHLKPSCWHKVRNNQISVVYAPCLLVFCKKTLCGYACLQQTRIFRQILFLFNLQRMGSSRMPLCEFSLYRNGTISSESHTWGISCVWTFPGMVDLAGLFEIYCWLKSHVAPRIHASLHSPS